MYIQYSRQLQKKIPSTPQHRAPCQRVHGDSDKLPDHHLPLPPRSRRATITISKKKRDTLMCFASTRVCPPVFVLCTRSDPAKSTCVCGSSSRSKRQQKTIASVYPTLCASCLAHTGALCRLSGNVYCCDVLRLHHFGFPDKPFDKIPLSKLRFLDVFSVDSNIHHGIVWHETRTVAAGAHAGIVSMFRNRKHHP